MTQERKEYLVTVLYYEGLADHEIAAKTGASLKFVREFLDGIEFDGIDDDRQPVMDVGNVTDYLGSDFTDEYEKPSLDDH